MLPSVFSTVFYGVTALYNLFSGLDELGFDDLAGLAVYDSETGGKAAAMDKKKDDIKKEIKPEDYIYEKNYDCPSCGKSFISHTLRQSRLKFSRSDTDLRNIFEPFDPIYYDAILCPHCGYAAMTAFFKNLTEKQADIIKAEITSRFKRKDYKAPYSVETAVERTKYALLNAVIRKARTSEKANICLKIAWLYRDAGDKTNEAIFIQKALEGFLMAREKETPPICGMDGDTLTYLIGDLYRRNGDISQAMKWIGQLVVDRQVKKSLKDKALELKELMVNERKQPQPGIQKK